MDLRNPVGSMLLVPILFVRKQVGFRPLVDPAMEKPHHNFLFPGNFV